MREKEYPPLLKDGFKEISEIDLEKEFVAPFSYNAANHRINLLKGFGNFLQEFKTLNLRTEVWIDGSFATWAPDPEDIDVVFYFSPEEVKALEKEKKDKYKKLFHDRKMIKNLYKVEVFQAVLGKESEHTKWLETFGTGYDNITSKGIFKLKYANP